MSSRRRRVPRGLSAAVRKAATNAKARREKELDGKIKSLNAVSMIMGKRQRRGSQIVADKAANVWLKKTLSKKSVTTALPYQTKSRKSDASPSSPAAATALVAAPPSEQKQAQIPLPTQFSTSSAVELVPHKHTLKCDRRERVCTIEGFMERSILRVRSLAGALPQEVAWYRVEGPGATCGVRVGSGFDYVLQRDDINQYMTAVVDGCICKQVAGPVQPGPSNLDKLTLVMCEGGKAIAAVAEYWGGHEGASEIQWIGVNHGIRQTIQGPLSFSPASLPPLDLANPRRGDPRYHFIRPEDRGTQIKVKYRPIRDDGWRGELKASHSIRV